MPIVIKPKSIKSFTNKGKDKIGGGGMDVGKTPKKKTVKKRFGGSLNKKNALKKAIQNVKNKTKSKTKKMNNKSKMV
tara:strand:- start:341 stop:571 length:231 start_codon:yes stop_codon:yes gene_type:complete